MGMTFRSIAALAALLALAACDGKPAPTTVTGPADPMAENMTTSNVAVELPPAVRSSKAYRCKDNSVVYVDLFQGDKQAGVRDTADGTPTTLHAEEAGKPLIADGYSLEVKGNVLKLARPGHPSQTCDG